MFKIALRSLGAHKIRLLLTAAAVFLGVAFVTGMLMLTNALDRTFTDIFESSAQDVLVTRTAAVAEDITQSTGDDQVQLISQKTVDEIRGVEGVRAADGGIFQNGAYLLDAEGEVVGGNGPPSAGVNWQPDPALAVANITQGRAPEAGDEIVVDEITFPKLDIPLDETVTMVVPSGRIKVTLVGVFRYGETGGLAGATITAFTPQRAQELFTEPGEWQSVEVAAADGFSDQQVADSFAAELGEGWTVKTRDQQVEEITASGSSPHTSTCACSGKQAVTHWCSPSTAYTQAEDEHPRASSSTMRENVPKLPCNPPNFRGCNTRRNPASR